jgi:hypothetical protein
MCDVLTSRSSCTLRFIIYLPRLSGEVADSSKGDGAVGNLSASYMLASRFMFNQGGRRHT